MKDVGKVTGVGETNVSLSDAQHRIENDIDVSTNSPASYFRYKFLILRNLLKLTEGG